MSSLPNVQYIYILINGIWSCLIFWHSCFWQRRALPSVPTSNNLVFIPLQTDRSMDAQLAVVDIVLHKATDEIVNVVITNPLGDRIQYSDSIKTLQRCWWTLSFFGKHTLLRSIWILKNALVQISCRASWETCGRPDRSTWPHSRSIPHPSALARFGRCQSQWHYCCPSTPFRGGINPAKPTYIVVQRVYGKRHLFNF